MAQFSWAKQSGPGKLYFTDFSLRPSIAETTVFGNRAAQFIETGFGEIHFSGVMPATEGSQALMRMAMAGNGFDFFQERREWRCVWCASPNPIDHRHCSQCGGPRGWIL